METFLNMCYVLKGRNISKNGKRALMLVSYAMYIGMKKAQLSKIGFI